MGDIPPELWGWVFLGFLGYLGALEVWAGVLYIWHALPAVGHGLLHVVTLGIK